MAEVVFPDQDWFSPEKVRERMIGFYKEKFSDFTEGLEFQMEPPLCNRFGFPLSPY